MNLLGITGVGADHTLLVAASDQNKPFKICLPSKILVLLNMMTKDQLLVQEEYEDIMQDIRDVISRYGKVVSMHAPQPKEGQNDCAGLGHIFVEYSAVSSAQYARRVASTHRRKSRRRSSTRSSSSAATTKRTSSTKKYMTSNSATSNSRLAVKLINNERYNLTRTAEIFARL